MVKDCLNGIKKNLYILYENLTGWLDNEKKVFVSVKKNYKQLKS